jgi:hypothetical protein
MSDLKNALGSQNLNIHSIIKNPFNSNSITHVRVSSTKGFFDKWIHSGIVEFKNGNTQAEQKFEGENIDDVLNQIRKFIEQLIGNK